MNRWRLFTLLHTDINMILENWKSKEREAAKRLLEVAKQQEEKRAVKAVRIDRSTIILVDADKDINEAKESFSEALNRSRTNLERMKFKDE